MAKEVKVLVACGSGVATSTIAQRDCKKCRGEDQIDERDDCRSSHQTKRRRCSFYYCQLPKSA